MGIVFFIVYFILFHQFVFSYCFQFKREAEGWCLPLEARKLYKEVENWNQIDSNYLLNQCDVIIITSFCQFVPSWRKRGCRGEDEVTLIITVVDTYKLIDTSKLIPCSLNESLFSFSQRAGSRQARVAVMAEGGWEHWIRACRNHRVNASKHVLRTHNPRSSTSIWHFLLSGKP